MKRVIEYDLSYIRMLLLKRIRLNFKKQILILSWCLKIIRPLILYHRRYPPSVENQRISGIGDWRMASGNEKEEGITIPTAFIILLLLLLIIRS